MNTFKYSEQNGKVLFKDLEQAIISKPALKKRDTITPATKWYDSYYKH